MEPWHSDLRWTWRGTADVQAVGTYELARRMIDCHLLVLRPQHNEPTTGRCLTPEDLIITPCAACPCCGRCTCSGAKLIEEPTWRDADDLIAVGDGYFAHPGRYDVTQRHGCHMLILRPNLGGAFAIRQPAPGDVILTECSPCSCCQGCACSESESDADEEALCLNCSGYLQWEAEMYPRWMALDSLRHRSGTFVQVKKRTHILTCSKLRGMLRDTIEYLQEGCQGNHGWRAYAWKTSELPDVLTKDQLDDRAPCATCQPDNSPGSRRRQPALQAEGQLTIGM